MAIYPHSIFTFLTLYVILFFSLCFKCSASNQMSIASDQSKFWSENVQNAMPKSIQKKLSPLSKNDCNYFSSLMSKNVNFLAGANFCSLANLACASVLDDVKTVKQTYTTTNTYSGAADLHRAVGKNEDPFSFFRVSVLKNGNLVHIPNLQESLPDRAFLPPQIASKISLTLNEINKIFPNIVRETKDTIETSLSYCNAEAIEGETKSCTKTLQELITFSKIALGQKKVIALTLKNTKGSNAVMMIKKIKTFDVDKIVACHEAYLPFALYFCHSLSSTQLYAVNVIEPKTGDLVNTLIALCHMDTSQWPANHVAFQILKFGPGEGEACHWMSQLDLTWIAAN